MFRHSTKDRSFLIGKILAFLGKLLSLVFPFCSKSIVMMTLYAPRLWVPLGALCDRQSRAMTLPAVSPLPKASHRPWNSCPWVEPAVKKQSFTVAPHAHFSVEGSPQIQGCGPPSARLNVFSHLWESRGAWVGSSFGNLGLERREGKGQWHLSEFRLFLITRNLGCV